MRTRRYHVTKLVGGFMPAIDRVPVIVRMIGPALGGTTAEIRFSRVTLQDAIGVAQRHLDKFPHCREVSILRGVQRLSVVTRDRNPLDIGG
jgi:hypothetical protein